MIEGINFDKWFTQEYKLISNPFFWPSHCFICLDLFKISSNVIELMFL